MPATDSARCAVTPAMVVRVSPNARRERRWNQRPKTATSGVTISVTSASRQSSTNRPMIAKTIVKRPQISAPSSADSTSLRVSTSLVRRLMIQPARCSEK